MERFANMLGSTLDDDHDVHEELATGRGLSLREDDDG